MSLNHPAKVAKDRIAAFAADQGGASAVYVAMITAGLIGVGALAVDQARRFGTHTEVASWADAAALACASQLNGSSNAMARGTQAAQQNVLLRNQQTFGNNGGQVSIREINFLSSLDPPTEVDASDPANDAVARFCEVVVDSDTFSNYLIPVLGGDRTTAISTQAVAGYTQVVCRIPPLMICNPAEAGPAGAGAPLGPTAGEQILVKATGPGAGWFPGGFGLVDPPTGGQGTPNIAELLASDDPDSGCFEYTLDVRPGQANGMREALNTRFDMYENPLFGGNEKNQAKYRPARNVTKGYLPQGGNACNVQSDTSSPPVAMGFPRDTCLVSGTCSTPLPTRQGDSNWDRTGYWNLNHPGRPQPPGYANMSRFDVYNYELNTPDPLNPGQMLIPNNSASGGENGNPACYGGDQSVLDDQPDRRILYLAVVNCLEEGPLSGNVDDVPMLGFAKVFLTEPVRDPPDGAEIWLEIIDYLEVGADDEVIHDIVQLYR